MKKKIIVAGAILVVLAGGFGINYAYTSYKEASHTSSNNHHYYNEDSGSLDKEPLATGEELLPEDELPSRDKVMTTPESIFCLVNKEYSLPADYTPADLVEPDVTFSIDYESEKKYMRKVAADALESLFQDAAKENLELAAVSGYRSYDRQKEIYEKNLKTRGTTHTSQYSAKPGYSEHQTGLVMDISCQSENFDLQESFGETPEGIWVAENAHLYGYIIRYPKDKCDITGYAYEPWHLRYVGVPMATYLYQNNMTLDEYYHYEPTYEFITDESEYVNDTPNQYDNNQSPSSVPTPVASSNSNSNSGNTANNNTNTVTPSKKPVVSKAPANNTTAETPSPSPEASASAPEASKKPIASLKPSEKPSKPSKAPVAEPSEEVPTPKPETPSKAPQTPEEEGDPDEGAHESGE